MDAEEMLVTAAGCHNGRIYIVVQKKNLYLHISKGKENRCKTTKFYETDDVSAHTLD